MKQRHTTWLIAILLLATGLFGAPAARVAAPRASSSIVWVYKAAKSRLDVSETREAGLSLRRAIVRRIVALDDCLFGATAVLDSALFQRPPPPTSLRA